MTSMPKTPALLAIAKRVVWYKDPNHVLADPVLVLCSVKTHMLPEDIADVQRHVSAKDMLDALDHAPAGLFDARGWLESWWLHFEASASL